MSEEEVIKFYNQFLTAQLSKSFFENEEELLKSKYFKDNIEKLFMANIKDKTAQLFLMKLYAYKLREDAGLNYNIFFVNNLKTPGYFSLAENAIYINSSLIKDSLEKNIEFLRVINHESRHMEQFGKLDISRELDRNFLKDGLLVLSLEDYNNPRWINYRLLSYEADARCESYLRTFEFLLKINPLIAKEFAKRDREAFILDAKQRESSIRCKDIHEVGNQLTFEFPKEKETTLDTLVNMYVKINEEVLQKYSYLELYLPFFEQMGLNMDINKKK